MLIGSQAHNRHAPPLYGNFFRSVATGDGTRIALKRTVSFASILVIADKALGRFRDRP